MRTLAFAILLAMASQALAEDNEVRYFMFIGEPSSAAWKFMMENPVDRENAVSAGMEAVGGKVLAYYFGLGNGKNYIIVELPDDNEVVQAVYLMRLPTGLLNTYEVIELMPSEQMAAALKRSTEFIQMEKDLGSADE